MFLTRRRRARQLAAVGATMAVVAATQASCDTYRIGDCSGSVKLTPGAGLMVASASAVCYGSQPPSRYSIYLYLDADGYSVGTSTSYTIPDSTGYIITVSVVCTTASYKATAIVLLTSSDGIASSGKATTTRKIRSQQECR